MSRARLRLTQRNVGVNNLNSTMPPTGLGLENAQRLEQLQNGTLHFSL